MIKRTWFLKVLGSCLYVCVSLLLFTTHSDGQLPFNFYGYQQSYNPYSYLQSNNPYTYLQPFNLYGYQQSYNPYNYLQPYCNPYDYLQPLNFYGYQQSYNPYSYLQPYLDPYAYLPYDPNTYPQPFNPYGNGLNDGSYDWIGYDLFLRGYVTAPPPDWSQVIWIDEFHGYDTATGSHIFK